MKQAIIAALAALFSLTPSQAQMRVDLGPRSPLRKMQIALMAIDNLYVDTVNAASLADASIRAMLSKLDPHSSYATAQETKELNEPLQGNFDGIGVQFNVVDDTLLVIQPVHGGPSERLGIRAGDRITAVNDTAIAGVKMSRTEIMRRLRGPRGTMVKVTVVRRSEPQPLTFNIKRAKIPVRSLDAAYLVEPGIGYIRLGSFGATTHAELRQSLDSLVAANTALYPGRQFRLLLDLQDNGGGYLSAAEEIASDFLKKGELIVYTTGRSIPRHESKAPADGRYSDIPLTILVNEYTASAAEIVSGAVQDHDRGRIVGRRTFGKGLVQRPVDLPDGSMIRLTVAHYYTPSGRCIQKPYKPGDRADYDLDFEQRLRHGELTCRDSIHFADSLRFTTLREGRAVYGGGGIMPDDFVPLDTLQYTRQHRMLVAKGIVVDKTLRYFDANRTSLESQYKSVSDFRSRYKAPQSLLADILAEGERQGVKPRDEAERRQTAAFLATQIEALVARDLFDESAYFELLNPTNRIYAAALKTIKQ